MVIAYGLMGYRLLNLSVPVVGHLAHCLFSLTHILVIIIIEVLFESLNSFEVGQIALPWKQSFKTF